VVEKPATRTSPPAAVLAAFDLAGSPVPLPGGQGTTWRVDDVVLKPLEMEPALVQWQATLLSRLDGREDFRVSAPLQTTDGQWTTRGWTAWHYQPGAHVPQRWYDIIAVGHLLHTALSSESEPAFLPRRTDKWSIGDKVAWAELPAAGYAHFNHVPRLTAALRPVEGCSQLIHGDLTGNVLFHETLPPLVIDLSLYWRPPAFASAIVIADALVFEGAPEDIVEPMLEEPGFSQYLLRALIYRIVTDDLARLQHAQPVTDDPYLTAVELAIRLTRAAHRPPEIAAPAGSDRLEGCEHPEAVDTGLVS